LDFLPSFEHATHSAAQFEKNTAPAFSRGRSFSDWIFGEWFVFFSFLQDGQTLTESFFMQDDAAEALDAVLESLHKLNLGDSDDSCIAHNVFGIKMSSFVSCRKCGKSSEPLTSNRFIEYVYISTLRELAIKRPNLPFETLLKISTQEFRGCPEPDEQVACTDILNPVTRQLMHIPEVLALGLVWPTSNPSPEEIISTLRIVQMQIELQNLFEFHPSLENSRTPFVLRGMICYYGKHYDAYYYCSVRHSWLVFDDATVKAVSKFATL
jgi:ubiquitin C-terminal hydrolase